MSESWRSVSTSPTSASRGGAVGKRQWISSAIAVAARKPLRNVRYAGFERW